MSSDATFVNRQIAALIRRNFVEAEFSYPTNDFGIELWEEVIPDGFALSAEVRVVVVYAEEYFHRFTHGDRNMRGESWAEARVRLEGMVEGLEGLG